MIIEPNYNSLIRIKGQKVSEHSMLVYVNGMKVERQIDHYILKMARVRLIPVLFEGEIIATTENGNVHIVSEANVK